MQRLYIDANAAIGRANHREPEIPWRTETLLQDMAACRIHGALITSQTARDYAFTLGNRQVIADARQSSRLFAVAVVAPAMQFELRDGNGYLDDLASQGARAFKVLPVSCEHEFSPFALEKIAGFLTDRGMPLVVDRSQASFEALRAVLQAFPALNVLLCGSYWSDNRNLLPLMERCPNLHFELSTNQANGLLALCKRHFGVDRVLFGTDYPNKSPGAQKATVEYSGLTDADKDLVAHGNAARLFGIDLAALAWYDEAQYSLDSIAAKVDRGLPLSDELVIDAHTHMVDREHQAVSLTPMYHSDADNIVATLDRLGVRSILTSPWEGIMTSEGGNDTALAAHQKYGDRIGCYATWNPHYPEDLDRVIGQYHEQHRFIGVKPYHPRHRKSLLDGCYDRWFAYGNRMRLIMLVHVESHDVADMVDTLAARYPDMAFLLAHSGQSYDIARYNVAVANRHPNVYLEITYTALTYGVIEYMVREAGADKVIYGSDLPMRDPAPQLGWVCYADIAVEDKRKILGGNIAKLMARCFPG